ncbi:hypothetical protein ACN4EG_22095 [Alkalinema pantanalense CENA528]|uniref:hypothetical protein n=1 Tax=Alkalinema pantanalense TaxID=1620705 RepID=UPI003D6FB30B
MTVEQTTQLLQLILNSILMVLASGCILGGAILRQQGLEKALQMTSAERFQALKFADNCPALHRKLRYLQQQARLNYRVLLLLNFACLLFVASTLSLILRSLINWVGLIHLSLFLFSLGTSAFLAGVLLLLFTFSQPLRGDRRLRRDPGQQSRSLLPSSPRSSPYPSSRRRLRLRNAQGRSSHQVTPVATPSNLARPAYKPRLLPPASSPSH